MKDLTFRLAGVTLPAGKYKPGAARDGNEDAMFVNLDLSDKMGLQPGPDKVYSLGDAGTIMVVADGMGGMNAGEVASQIAIDSVRAAFLPEKITPQVLESAQSRAAYMENVIRLANQNILDNAAANPSRTGMGSTIIMAWLMPSGELTLTWVGDSRAYVYNPSIGIHALSEDQSFVQQLVRKGLITYEQSFDHPQNNVIMHSLGDASQPCNPETRQFNVGKGDILLLCSDGLTGVVRDRPGKNPATGLPYPEENLQDLIKQNSDSMEECLKELVKAAERGKWYDNVTVVLCQIVDGPKSQAGPQTARFEKELARTIRQSKSEIGGGAVGNAISSMGNAIGKSRKGLLIGILALVVLGIVCWLGFVLLGNKETDNEKNPAEQVDRASKSEDISEEEQSSGQTNLPQQIQSPTNNPSAPAIPTPGNSKPGSNPQSIQGTPNPQTPSTPPQQPIVGNTGGNQGRTGQGRTNDLQPGADPNKDKGSTINMNEKEGGLTLEQRIIQQNDTRPKENQ